MEGPRRTLVEKATKRKIRKLRTDNGGEYTSIQFKSHLKAEGIRHELTIPKTPEQNGIAERLNKSLVEMARSMLLDAKLPKKFWAEAISTAVYLKNRSPSKALKITPYQAYCGTKPNVNHCLAVMRMLTFQRTRDRNLTPRRGSVSIMVGYGTVTKRYRLYDMEKRKIVHSRDVKFDEHGKDCQQTSPDSTADDYRLIAEFSNDSDDQESADDTQVEENPPETSVTLRRSTRQKTA